MAAASSILIPNRDCPVIDRTLDALRDPARQHGAEILVVGTDRHGLVPRGGPNDVDPVRFLESETALSPAAARNRAVAAAEGDLLLFTDADCAPRPDWIGRMRASLETAPIVGGAVSFDLTANEWAVADNIASFHDLLEDRPAERDTERPVGTLNLAVRRAAWETVGGFDEELVTSEDFDWFLRARKAGLEATFEPAAVVEHAAVRNSREELEGHAAWYGRHFAAFRARHPGIFDSGPTWKNRWLFRAAAPLKARAKASRIFRDHPILSPARSVLPGVVSFYRAWYRAVAEGWNRG